MGTEHQRDELPYSNCAPAGKQPGNRPRTSILSEALTRSREHSQRTSGIARIQSIAHGTTCRLFPAGNGRRCTRRISRTSRTPDQGPPRSECRRRSRALVVGVLASLATSNHFIRCGMRVAVSRSGRAGRLRSWRRHAQIDRTPTPARPALAGRRVSGLATLNGGS